MTVTTTATGGDATRLDAVVVQPLVTRLVLGGDGHGTALLRNASTRAQHAEVAVPGSGRADVWAYDGLGRLRAHHTDPGSTIGVEVPPGGFVLARR